MDRWIDTHIHALTHIYIKLKQQCVCIYIYTASLILSLKTEFLFWIFNRLLISSYMSLASFQSQTIPYHVTHSLIDRVTSDTRLTRGLFPGPSAL